MAKRKVIKKRPTDVVIVAGMRTPLTKSSGAFDALSAVDLGVLAIRELLARSPVHSDDIDQVIIGNVIQPAEATNIARVISLTAGLSHAIPAHTVHRNCASGMQAITDAAEKIQLGRSDVIIAGGVESMTHAPLLFHDRFRAAMAKLPRARTLQQKIPVLTEIAKAPWKPRISLLEGLTDPTIGMGMGQTAEVLAREFNITREEQDTFALQSHQRAAAAWDAGFYDDEVMHVFAAPSFKDVHRDEGIRASQSMQALKKLKPAFDRPLGTVTAGNSSQITDGAAMLVLARREKAEAEGWPVLGCLHDWAYSGCDPKRMGLGPVFAMHAVLQAADLRMSDVDRVEINEAFAVQVLANLKAMESTAFAEQQGWLTSMGAPDMDKLNVHGGAIAMGHPVGMTGARLILTLLRQLRGECDGGLGLASLCIGGGQGGAVLLSSEAAGLAS
ncbi:thiolase family protein [Mariprofundus sp. EBB-1]|uniref:thiolase family protein n=1 Tax=Mariprofundus sp. EBB-1 TaxID=2650971 RepID=UPI000EF1D05C|nr:thiolase family protein [Mariprofundus sp. EBB-1]RLL55041.1 thiolase family protein [Mariprofundus sp. EBB-1]